MTVDTVCNGSKKLSTHRCSLKLDQFAGSPPCNLAVSTADCWEWRTLGTGQWLGINFNWITESGSLHPSAGWLVMGDMSRAGPLWPMTPFDNVSSLCPFIKVTTALRLIFILNLTSCQQKQKLFFCVVLCFRACLTLGLQTKWVCKWIFLLEHPLQSFYLREHNGRCLHSITPSMPQLVKLFAKFLMQTGTAALQFCFLHLIRKQRHHKNTSFALSCVNFI